jgi:GT2 family glycosyltransferase
MTAIQDVKTLLGSVVIGRNEGERLKRCLASLAAASTRTVYVDSGSSDGSVEHARSVGVDVVELDLSIPFTAARARNEGFARLLTLYPELTYVQFVDGDCEVVADWIPKAVNFLESHPGCAVVCGRRRERYPEQSIYNWICDREWDTPVGEATSCGGDALMRCDALRAAGGYRADMIAGEEPELCLRLRHAGWSIWRIDAEMTLHDAAMHRFAQWWTRSVRSGHAYGEGAWLHGRSTDRHWVRENIRALIWSIGIPALALFMGLTKGPWALLILGVYPLQVVRMWFRSGSLAQALLTVLSRFAETVGIWRFHVRRWRGGALSLIEYK